MQAFYAAPAAVSENSQPPKLSQVLVVSSSQALRGLGVCFHARDCQGRLEATTDYHKLAGPPSDQILGNWGWA